MGNAAYVMPFELPDWGYEEALARLHQALHFGIDPKIETVEDMLAELGDPDLSYASLQVAGTNGKTSTSRYAAAILAGEGYRTGLYTSPELVRYTERVEVDGTPVDDGLFGKGIAAAALAGERVNAAREAAGEKPYDITEFDLLTVGACVMYALAGVDVVVFEVGMGGRWDATSAVRSIRSVAITGIGLDHMRILGDTLEAIAGEKAAVIRHGRSCVLGVGTALPTSVENVFLERCAAEGVLPTLLRPLDVRDAAGEMGAGVPLEHPRLPHASYAITRRPGRLGGALVLDVETPQARYAELSALKPAYQAANIACAIVLVEAFLGRALDREALYESVVRCPTPGRFDLMRPEPLALVDACHNPQSVETFLTAVRELEGAVERRPALLVAALADKDVHAMVALLAPEFPKVYATATSSPRALPADEMAALFAQAGKPVAAVYPTVAEVLAALADTPFVACGSITLAGEIAGLLRA